ncbi:LOW QUALITY PROTEIN: hypothetical protein NC653_011703 [Populus alba x Populus x berolinensis]|uniref:3-oxo-5-alpha-steroid 4-dehydrogenase C-terminal domain-containing protein n=1 Tax=Populus alba x Populus x berolinensis TaxID=444605 RepID=A0AAD6W6Q8_9ROSI|nr:LOW QUALITY PROTEIN: hypothetical protein NC653_011703 [Populus alba x Populus x berolinensis]
MNEDIVDTGQDTSPCFGWESWNVGSYSCKKEVCGNQMIFREMRSNNYMFSGKGRPSCCKIKRLAYILTFTIMMGSLREHVGKVDEYVIPRGDWFEIVSSPHYLAEIVIYAGIVFGSGGADLTIWLLFGFVLQKHIGGIFRNLTIIQATVLQLFHLYDKISKNTFPIVACCCHHGYHKFLTCDEKIFVENQISLIGEYLYHLKDGVLVSVHGMPRCPYRSIEFYLILLTSRPIRWCKD